MNQSNSNEWLNKELIIHFGLSKRIFTAKDLKFIPIKHLQKQMQLHNTYKKEVGKYVYISSIHDLILKIVEKQEKYNPIEELFEKVEIYRKNMKVENEICPYCGGTDTINLLVDSWCNDCQKDFIEGEKPKFPINPEHLKVKIGKTSPDTISIINLNEYQAFYICEKAYESITRWSIRSQDPRSHPLFPIIEPLLNTLDETRFSFITNVKTYLEFLKTIGSEENRT